MTGSEPTLREHGVEYDPQDDWLTVTDEGGVTQIVGYAVPAWFGVRVVAAFDHLAALPPAAPETWTCPTCHTPMPADAAVGHLRGTDKEKE